MSEPPPAVAPSAAPLLPLAGRRIAITRPAEQSDELARGIRALGGEPVLRPAIAIMPSADPQALDAALASLARYAWVAVTSANAARALGERLAAGGLALPDGVRIAAVGPATAAALARHVRAPDLVADEHVAEALAGAIPVAPGERVLFPRAELARDALPDALRRRGALVDEAVAYRTEPGAGIEQLTAELRAGALDAVLFASASAARFTAERLADAVEPTGSSAPHRRGRAAIFCLGPATAAEARAHGLVVDGVAEPHTIEGLLRLVARWFASSEGATP